MTPSQLRVLDAINSSSFPLVLLSPENVTLEELAAGGSVSEGWNTRATVRARPEGQFQRAATVFYNRLPLSVLGEDLSYLAANIFTPQQLLDAINNSRNAQLTLDELDAFAIPDLPAPGQSQTITLAARSDSYGWLGSLGVMLHVPSGDVIAHISITDGILQTAASPPTRKANFTVSLDQVSNLPVTVDYTTVPGSAAAGVDFVTQSGTLTFTPGQISKTILVTVRNTNDSQAEDFIVQLSNPYNSRIIVDHGTCVLPAGV